ncbi:MAG: hypothetical protein JRJ85_17355, partial [Deltaproteobacteria bacterium]|nr:hypothetical protein [Deltaproteobacteria bacterium]
RQTFIFYDDTSWPAKDPAPIEYLVSPGDVTGDAGDPGNITTIGSLDRRLYSPQLMMLNFLNVTPNRDGEAKVWHSIFSSDEDDQDKKSAPGTPEHERFNGWQQTFDELIHNITYEEERESWLDMWNDPANPRDGTVDGSLYERTPFYYISVGPYDLEPGESVSWTYIMCLGEMDRNISQLGGLNAATQFKAEGLTNIRANYDAALELIANNYQLPDDEYPPPTCGTPPYVISDNNKLEVAEFSEVVDGAASQGFELSWLAVPADYTDPGTGESDFAGYKIYSSEIHITGPWEEIRNLTAAEVEPYRDGDQIVYRVEVEPGIPYRFAVTSYDTHGLESGMTAYTFFAEAAKRAPSNQMSTIKVIPNPFRQTSGLLDPGESDRIAFVNIPAQCTIRIYTLAGDLVKDIEHDGLGEVSWGQSDNDTYMLTNFGSAVAPGLYIYHIESHVAGNEGETHIGKFMIIN